MRSPIALWVLLSDTTAKGGLKPSAATRSASRPFRLSAKTMLS